MKNGYRFLRYYASNLAKILIKTGIRFYQRVFSPLLGPRCRFYPSCSDYALLAYQKYGLRQGTYFFARRLLKCHPYHSGGYDPVPDTASVTLA